MTGSTPHTFRAGGDRVTRDGMPLTSPRWLQVIPPGLADLYRTNHVVAGFSPLFVAGFMVPLAQVGPAPTAERLIASLRPDHPTMSAGGPELTPAADVPRTGDTARGLHTPGGGLLVLTFDVDTDTRRTVIPSRIGERILPGRFAAPWNGSGHPDTGAPSFIDEYVALEPLHLLPGARLDHISVDGGVAPVCRLELDPDGAWTWRDPAGQAVVETSATTDLHECFAEVGEPHPVEPLDPRWAMVTAPDRRVLRLRLRGALEGIDVAGTTARGLLDRSSVPRLAVRTTATIAGLGCTVRTMRPGPDGEWLLGVTHVGRADGEAARLGFRGDQYTGLRAEFPASAFDHLEVQRLVTTGSDATRRIPAPPFPPLDCIPHTPSWHREFLQLASGAVVPVSGGPGRLLSPVPDPRAADLMFPGHAGVLRDPTGRVRADLGTVSGLRVDAVTRAALHEDFEVLVVGEEGLSVRYVNIPRNGRDPHLNMVRSVNARHVGPQRDLLVEPGEWGAGE